MSTVCVTAQVESSKTGSEVMESAQTSHVYLWVRI